MTREDFYHSVQENIKAMLPQDFLAYDVNLRKMDVSYGEYMGLTIGMFGESVEPVFNLDRGSEDSNTHGYIRQICTYTASIILTVNILRSAMIFLSKYKSAWIELLHLTARDF